MDRIPDPERKLRVAEVLKLAHDVIELNDEIEDHAEILVKAGIKPVDALHVATASAASANYFCTCDARLLKKGKRLTGLTTKVVSPLELLMEVAP